MRSLLLSCLMTFACCCSAPKSQDAAEPAPEPQSPPVDTSQPPPDPNCGARTDDWCPSPAGDPCGAHPNEAACRADPRCVGMPYRGESFVPCKPDGKGFWENCPAVGCVSKPP